MSKFSIVTSTLNAEKYLPILLNSFNQQTHIYKELIIIDGGSTDRTQEILKENTHLLTYWQSKPDRGIYHAWNMALPYVTGDWVCFLGADDKFHQNNTLEKLNAFIESKTFLGHLVYGGLKILPSNLDHPVFDWKKSKAMLRSRMSLPHPALFYSSKIFKDGLRFQEKFRVAGDYDFVLQVLNYYKDTIDVIYLNETLTEMMDQGVSSDRLLSVMEAMIALYSREKIIPPRIIFSLLKQTIIKYLKI